jgi:hypothetical protein
MQFLVDIFKKIVRLPVIYAVTLSLQALVIWDGWQPREWSLRGGISAQLLVQLVVLLISLGAIVQAWCSRLPKAAKFGLTVLQGPGIGLLGFLICRMLPIVLIFGLGACRITTHSPSGQRSITIEDACFMGCTHTVFANSWMLERQIGEAALSNGRFCTSDPTFTWNQAETQVRWQVRNESGTIKL